MDNATKKRIAAAVYKRRGGRTGMSLRDAADECGVNFATLSRIETGRGCNADTLAKIDTWLAGANTKGHYRDGQD